MFHLTFQEKFIIHAVKDDSSIELGNHFIILRNYLRTHPQQRSDYSAEKINISSSSLSLSVKEYAEQKNCIVNDLMDQAVVWHRENQNFVHIGSFDSGKNQWSCCGPEKDGRNMNLYGLNNTGGCYNPALKMDTYHTGRFRYEEYRIVRGWWSCCSEGQYSKGCKKIETPVFLSNGDGE